MHLLSEFLKWCIFGKFIDKSGPDSWTDSRKIVTCEEHVIITSWKQKIRYKTKKKLELLKTKYAISINKHKCSNPSSMGRIFQ